MQSYVRNEDMRGLIFSFVGKGIRKRLKMPYFALTRRLFGVFFTKCEVSRLPGSKELKHMQCSVIKEEDKEKKIISASKTNEAGIKRFVPFVFERLKDYKKQLLIHVFVHYGKSL